MQRAVKKSRQRINQPGAQRKIAKQHKRKENGYDAAIPQKETALCAFKCRTRKGEEVKEKSEETENEREFAAHGISVFKCLQ